MPVPGVSCERCGVTYDPRPVGYACPVCGTATPGRAARVRSSGDHALQLVAAATVANVLLLSVLAVLLLR